MGVSNGFSVCSIHTILLLVSTPHFLEIVVEVRATELPHFVKLWLRVNKAILPANFLHLQINSFVASEFHDVYMATTESR